MLRFTLRHILNQLRNNLIYPVLEEEEKKAQTNQQRQQQLAFGQAPEESVAGEQGQHSILLFLQNQEVTDEKSNVLE